MKHASAGALYTDTCPCHTAKPEEHCETSCEHCDLPGDCDKVRVFEIALVQARITYNRYGDHDPDGLIFVPLQDVELLKSGKYQPKPLILRANAGD
ncbi:MAG: hypothetical protein MR729_11120 [Dorea sp.]|uniref:hypothetical protein n=1 Tax=Dorea sp. YH-dor226 TaxID=3151119 RepID=UPI00304993F6|nr:hypothetical protein [Dorea sp.]